VKTDDVEWMHGALVDWHAAEDSTRAAADCY
jgi:hypothetical protein